MLSSARLRALLVLAVLATAPVAAADEAPSAPTAQQGAPPVKSARQGVAVVGMANARDEAFQLARGIYASPARPGNLDEVRARILAGDPPGNASKDLRDLAELRGGITGEDAASRQLLSSLADKLGVQAILVVHKNYLLPTTPAAPSPAPAASGDAGAAPVATGEVVASAPAEPPAATVTARLFLADPAEFDAASYSPESAEPGTSPWQGTIRSVTTRFPAAPGLAVRPHAAMQPAKVPTDSSKDSKPFWTSPWLWVGLGAAALAGVGLYFATRSDNSSDPIHLQLRVP